MFLLYFIGDKIKRIRYFSMFLIDFDQYRRGSSVVERVIGNDEAESSILSRGTIYL